MPCGDCISIVPEQTIIVFPKWYTGIRPYVYCILTINRRENIPQYINWGPVYKQREINIRISNVIYI